MKKILTLSLLGLLFAGRLNAQLNETEYLPGNILVMLQAGASAEKLANDLAVLDGQPTGLHVDKEVSAPLRTWLLRFDDMAVAQWNMLRAVRNHPSVMLAQNDHVVKERAVPNDAQYNQQWHHQNIDSEAAWDISTGGVTMGGDTIVVAIIENADLSHADLSGNAWINHGEIAGNGLDDDANGYVDDVRGWNTPSNNDNVYSGSHGTQCAGMAGAVGNNGQGVVGANWNVKLMPVNYGGVSESAVLAAYTYPLVMRRLYNESNGDRGAFIVVTSASWGIDGGQPADSPLWCAMYDTLGTAGVLNCGATANNAVDVDAVGDLPTACGSDFMISVTATDNNDQRTFSAWGLTTIDVGAPGSSVRTTSIGGGYGNTSGTSFACPLTAGVIGLLYSAPCASLSALAHADPQQGALYVREKLFEGVEQVGNLPGNTVTGGRISSGNSMQLIMTGCSSCPPPFGGLVERVGANATFSWSATTEGPFNVRFRAVGAPDWTEVMGLEASNLTVTDVEPCTAYEFQVEMVCGGELSGYSNSFVLPAPEEGAPVITASGYPEFCAGTPFTLTSSVGNNVSWSSGEGTASISPQQSGSYTVTFTGQCGTYTSDPFDISVITTPVAPVAPDVQLAGPGVATLTATGDNITWYDAPVGGNTVGTGSPWDTPSLTATTSFWCSAANTNGSVPFFGGKTNNTTSGQYHTNATNYELFTANQLFVIRSVKVYSNSAGVRPIALVDGNGNVITQGNFNIPDGESRVQLNFTVPGPGNYGLKVVSGNPGLWRDGIGSVQTYPYPLGAFGNITGSSATGGNSTIYYYFFYDWEVSDPLVMCESPREEVVVELPASVGELVEGAVRVFPNPADRDVFINIEGALAGERLTFSVIDAAGREVASKRIIGGRATFTTAFLSSGLYAYRIMRDGQVVHADRFMVEHLW